MVRDHDAASPAHWISEFMAAHRERFDPHDWPPGDSEKYAHMVEDWAAAFASEKITEPEARRASRRLVAKPPKYKREHLPAILNAIRHMRTAGETKAATLDEAKRLAAECPRCDGHGWVIVYDPAPGSAAKRPKSIAATCVCALGRHSRECYGSSRVSRETLKRIPDLADILAGRVGPSGVRYQIEPPVYESIDAERSAYFGKPKT